MHRVFVYGTLKRGFRNHRILANAAFVGNAHTVAAYRMLDGRFPVLRDSGPGRMPVSGEVYDVDHPTLEKLDELESIETGMYDRVEAEIVMAGDLDSRHASAFIYIGGRDYWDKKATVSYLVTDERGYLNWLAPDMRHK